VNIPPFKINVDVLYVFCSILEDVWAWRLWDKYASTEQWATPYLVGLGTGLFLERAVKDRLSITRVSTAHVLYFGKGLQKQPFFPAIIACTASSALVLSVARFRNFVNFNRV